MPSPRESFDRHLHELQDDLLVMGSMVEKALERSMEALKNRNLEMAHQVIEDDAKINQKRFDIEEKCIELIATQQPMASDLRVIIAVLNIIVDLERIADHAEGNAKIAVMIGNEPPLKPLIDLPRMCQKTVEMLRRSLDAFVNRDAEVASQICGEDDEVDNSMTRCSGNCSRSWPKTPGPSPGPRASSGWGTTWSAAPTG